MSKAPALFRPFLAAFMLLTMIALGVLWIDSYRSRGITTNFSNDKPQIGMRYSTPDLSEMDKPFDWGVFGVRTQLGELHLMLVTFNDQNPGTDDWKLPGLRYYTSSPVRGHPNEGQRWRILHVSFALLILLCAVYPVLAIVRGPIRRRRRRNRGACLRCGYDLTGNVTGICPECALPAPAEGSR